MYRLFGNAESQNRRIKGDNEIRLHLMALDYVLENSGEHFLETTDAKLDFFLNVRGIPSSFVRTKHRQLCLFVSNFPISIADVMRPATSVVRFPFMDEGLLSTKKFTRFLGELAPLMLALGTFEVIYTAVSSTNFLAAEAIFRKTFETTITNRQEILPELCSPFAPDGLGWRPLQARLTTLYSRGEARNTHPH
jgi:hypothetical protein